MAETDLSKLDLSGLQFPSDSLTIRSFRLKHPELFDRGFGDDDEMQPLFFLDGHAEHTVGNMLYVERLVAAAAFAKAAGISPFKLPVAVEDLEEGLAKQYVEYGVATGPHHAAELIRGIESQGRGLASRGK